MHETEEIKKRNEAICKEWADWHDDEENTASEPVSALKARISQKYGIAQQYVYHILRDNIGLLSECVEWRKKKRLWKLRRLMGAARGSKKDITDLMEQERKELEGNTPLIDQSQHHTLILQIEKSDDKEIATARKSMANI